MSGFKLLIDTNIVIGLEDSRPVAIPFAELARKCSEHAVRLFIHGAVFDDISRDKDVLRRAVTTSKLQKFESLLSTKVASEQELFDRYGPVVNDNDRSDIRLIEALRTGAVDFLISQDLGLHKRAERANLGASVLTVEEALEWLRQTFEPKTVRLPYVVSRKAYEIDRSDQLFDSLREGYPGFDRWFAKCAHEHRDCWVVEVGNELAGIVIRKDETYVEAQTRHKGPKILKVCTFKMKPEFRGEKFGEQLLKQILWYAQRNSYDLVYLTAFPSQQFLVDLLSYYGFEVSMERQNGELVLEKPIVKGKLVNPSDGDVFALDRRAYPRFYDGDAVKKFCVPIRPDYHRKLFPEIAQELQPSLFSDEWLRDPNRTPGNTIRKVYLCRAKTRGLRPGDLLCFYMSKDERFIGSQSITSIGIVEAVREASTLEALIHLTAKRSVFSVDELRDMAKGSTGPVKVVDFLLVGHLERPIPLKSLIQTGIFQRRPPQSIAQISRDRSNRLIPLLELGYPP